MARIFLLAAVCIGLSACSMLFPTEAGESLAHFETTAPAEAMPAPDFRLTDIDGNEVTLTDLVREKPVVVQLGSYSCPVFRYRRFDVQKLQRDFAGRVDFVVIYTQEAHPYDAINPYEDRIWNPLINKAFGVNVAQHRTLEERRLQASATYEAVELDSRFLIDSMDNAVWRQYGAAPSAAYVLDAGGTIRLRQAWVNPREIRKVLDKLLEE